MFDRAFIREHPDIVRRSLERRGLTGDVVDDVLAKDAAWRKTLTDLEALKAERNRLSSGFAEAKQRGPDAVSELREQSLQIGERIKDLERLTDEQERGLSAVLEQIPNLLADDVPDGKDSSSNVEVRRVGDPPHFDFPPRPHWEIGEQLGIIDFERGVRLARSRFVVLRGAGARLNRALVDFFLERNIATGYCEIAPPLLVNRDTVQATGHLSKFSDLMFSVEDGALFLSPTAEVQLVNLHRGEILSAEQLPLRYTAYTPCFREEAGAAGKDTRGLIRLHQFEKVELVGLCAPEEAAALHDQIVSQAESLLRALGLPYRVVLLCAGDTGFASRKTYDLEVWLPGQGGYREISSCSDCGDFQARRAGIRYRPNPKARPDFVHTLNGSALAIGRTLLAILENYQQADGSVRIPEALRPYMQQQTVIAAA